MSTFCLRPEIHHVDPAKDSAEHYWCYCCGSVITPVEPLDRKGEWKHAFDSQICEEGNDLPSPCFFVEFSILWEDRTWSTETVEVPHIYSHDRATDEDLVEWFQAVHVRGDSYRKAVQFGVFSIQ
jgi:hypothetical protein